jgi:hypothetical protein
MGIDKPLGAVSPSEKERIIALDVIMYNADRHGGNWVIDPSGRTWAIDHGHAQWQVFETSNRAPMWNSELLKKAPSGRFDFSDALLGKLRKVTRSEFDAIFEGVDQSRNVNADAAWQNLQYIVENGRIEW